MPFDRQPGPYGYDELESLLEWQVKTPLWAVLEASGCWIVINSGAFLLTGKTLLGLILFLFGLYTLFVNHLAKRGRPRDSKWKTILLRTAFEPKPTTGNRANLEMRGLFMAMSAISLATASYGLMVIERAETYAPPLQGIEKSEAIATGSKFINQYYGMEPEQAPLKSVTALGRYWLLSFESKDKEMFVTISETNTVIDHKAQEDGVVFPSKQHPFTR